LERLQNKAPKQIIYLDEAGIDNRSGYPYGYSPRGERVYALKDGKRTERVSWKRHSRTALFPFDL